MLILKHNYIQFLTYYILPPWADIKHTKKPCKMSNNEPSDRWDCWNHSLPPTFDSPPCTSDRRQAFAAGRVSRWDTNSRTDGPADRTCDMFDSRFRCRRNSPSVVRDMRSSSLVWFRWRLLPVMAVNWTKRNINYSHGICRLNKLRTLLRIHQICTIHFHVWKWELDIS